MKYLESFRHKISRPGNLVDDRAALWRMTGGRCFWCDGAMNLAGDPMSSRYMTIDHLNARGSGLPRAQSKIASCRSCNEERGNLSADRYWQIWAFRLSAGVAA